jgi:hypothetical protein
VIDWIFAVLLLSFGDPIEGKASVFGGADDKHRGGETYCFKPPRRVRADDWGLATRQGKCGDLYLVVNPRTGGWAVVPRIDAGPYGAKHNGTWVLKKRRSDPGRWIGVADLTRPVAKAIGHRGGKERVLLRRFRR